MVNENKSPEKRVIVRRKTRRDTGVPVASYLLGIALSLIVFVMFGAFGNSIMSWAVSALLFLLFLVIIISVVKPSRQIIVKKNDVKMVKEAVVSNDDSDEKKVRNVKGKYVGSTETRTYHDKDCRFAKGIKAKYRLDSDSPSYFKDKKFDKCKTCKPR